MYKFLIALLALISLSSVSHSKSDSCQMNNQLFDAQFISLPPQEFEIMSDKSEIIGKNLFNLSGNVEIISNNIYISGNQINIDKDEEKFSSSGSVKYKNTFLSLIGNNMKYDGEKVESSDAKFVLINPSSHGHSKYISAERNLKILTNTTFTFCPVRNHDWVIEADSITLDSSSNSGVAKNAKLVFFGVPIFFLPEFEWVLSGRGSGFLTPSYSKYQSATTSDSGTLLQVPYYFNLAKDRDFLLNLEYFSKNGLNYDTKYRQLLSKTDFWKKGSLEIQNSYLPEDKISDRDRWETKAKVKISVDDSSEIRIVNHRVSDKDYFRDLDSDNSVDKLSSKISYNRFSNEDNLKVIAENIQVVNNGEYSYIRQPELNYQRKIESKGYEFNLSLNSTQFKHKNKSKVNGERYHLETNIKRNLNLNGLKITPEITNFSTNYNLSNRSDIYRSINKFSIYSELPLVKKLSILGENYNNFLTPKISFNYVESKNQSSIPNFDTVLLESGHTKYGKFIGLDKINNEKNISLAVQSSLINLENYLNLNANIFQKINFNNQEIGIDGNLESVKKYSNIFLSSDFTKDKNFFSLNSSYNPYKNRLDSSSLNYEYTSNSKKVFGLGFVNDSNRSGFFNFAYPMTKNVQLFGSLSKNFTSNLNNKKLYGIVYESCCWEATVAKFSSDNNLNDSSLSFQLTFKDLASTSTSLKERIRKEIPNYYNE